LFLIDFIARFGDYRPALAAPVQAELKPPLPAGNSSPSHACVLLLCEAFNWSLPSVVTVLSCSNA